MIKLLKKIADWVAGKSLLDKPLDKDYTDEFRIKAITLKSGVSKFFPQYKSGLMSQWETLISINTIGIGSIFISDQEMVDTNMSYCPTEESARNYIELFKQQLTEQRSNEYLDEKIIKL